MRVEEFRQWPSTSVAFYKAQVNQGVWKRGSIHPDVAVALAALFAPMERRDVALLVRMTWPQQLPDTLLGIDLYVSKCGVVRYRGSMKDGRGRTCSAAVEVLKFLCDPSRSPTVTLVGAGMLPSKALLRNSDFGPILTLAADTGSLDLYELVLQQCRVFSYGLIEHARHLLDCIATQVIKFRFLKSLYRRAPDAVRNAIPCHDYIRRCRAEFYRRWCWTTTWWPSSDCYLQPICGFGDCRHVSILRAIFAEFPSLRISEVDLRAAFGNASAFGLSQPDPLLRLICEELPHTTPTLLSDCGHAVLFRVASFVNQDARVESYSPLSSLKCYRPPPNQHLALPRNSAQELKIKQLFIDRVRYVVRDLKVKPDAATLLVVFPTNRVLFDELVFQYNALHNNHEDVEVAIAFWRLFLNLSIDEERHAQLFPPDAAMPVLDAADLVLDWRFRAEVKVIRLMADRLRHDIFFSPVIAAARLGRMEKYVKVRFDGLDAPNDAFRTKPIQCLEDVDGRWWGRPPNFQGEIYNERSASPRFLHRNITVDTIDYIAKYGFDVKMKNSEGNTLLHAAAMNDNCKLFVHLIAKFKLNPMEENRKKQSAWTLVPENGEIQKSQREGKILPPSVPRDKDNNKLPPLASDGRRRRNIMRPA